MRYFTQRITFGVLVLLLASFPRIAPAENIQLGLRVPEGFEIVEFAGSELANDIYCMTLDARGPATLASAQPNVPSPGTFQPPLDALCVTAYTTLLTSRARAKNNPPVVR